MSDALSANGVNISFLKQIDGPTGTAVILLQPSGRHEICPCLKDVQERTAS